MDFVSNCLRQKVPKPHSFIASHMELLTLSCGMVDLEHYAVYQ